jgi:hypothetical protein
MKFKPEAKVYRVRIDVEVVATDRQGAVDGAIGAWQNGGRVREQVEVIEGREPDPAWMAYDEAAVVRERRR